MYLDVLISILYVYYLTHAHTAFDFDGLRGYHFTIDISHAFDGYLFCMICNIIRMLLLPPPP